MLVGDAVAQAQAIFDDFWNSDEIVPIDALVPKSRMKLGKLRARLERLTGERPAARFLPALQAADDGVDELLGVGGRLRWVAEAQVISDPPEKAASRNEEGWIARIVLRSIRSAGASLNVISPYFIPRDDGVAVFGGLVEKGVKVDILTNSLAATDVVATYGAYARYRKGLLRRGVQLYELRAELSRPKASLMGSSLTGSGGRGIGSRSGALIGSKAASLHTKAFTVDGKLGFVGSFNFDPRSVALNTEMGVLFTDEQLTAEVDAIFAEQIAPAKSYRLLLKGRRLVWSEGAREASSDIEPRAGFWRRVVARIVRWLPIESQL